MAAAKIASITGGCRGIGKALAIKFLQNGAKKVYIGDIFQAEGVNVAKELQEKYGNGTVEFYHCDITKLNEFEEFFQLTCFNRPVDIYVNNAGTLTEEDAIKTNLNGTHNGIKLALKYMARPLVVGDLKKRKRETPVILNIASTLGMVPEQYFPKYGMASAGIIGLSKVYSKEFYKNKYGVNVICVCAGPTDTDMGKKMQEVEQSRKEVDSKNRKFELQKIEVVTSGCMKALIKNANGSFWVSSNGENYEIDFPDYTKLKIKSNE